MADASSEAVEGIAAGAVAERMAELEKKTAELKAELKQQTAELKAELKQQTAELEKKVALLQESQEASQIQMHGQIEQGEEYADAGELRTPSAERVIDILI
jgi:predicted phage gp36 major capsid-like protein